MMPVINTNTTYMAFGYYASLFPWQNNLWPFISQFGLLYLNWKITSCNADFIRIVRYCKFTIARKKTDKIDKVTITLYPLYSMAEIIFHYSTCLRGKTNKHKTAQSNAHSHSFLWPLLKVILSLSITLSLSLSLSPLLSLCLYPSLFYQSLSLYHHSLYISLYITLSLLLSLALYHSLALYTLYHSLSLSISLSLALSVSISRSLSLSITLSHLSLSLSLSLALSICLSLSLSYHSLSLYHLYHSLSLSLSITLSLLLSLSSITLSLSISLLSLSYHSLALLSLSLSLSSLSLSLILLFCIHKTNWKRSFSLYIVDEKSFNTGLFLQLRLESVISKYFSDLLLTNAYQLNNIYIERLFQYFGAAVVAEVEGLYYI